MNELSEKVQAIIASALGSPEGSVERLHATTRLQFAVKTGLAPESTLDLLNPVIADAGAYDVNSDSYMASRQRCASALAEFGDESGLNYYDPDGKVARMIDRGEPKERIVEHLYNNVPDFLDDFEYISGTAPEEYDNYQKSVADFHDALDGLEESPEPIDVRKRCCDHIEEHGYDYHGDVIPAINDGADSGQVMLLLQNSPRWQGANADWLEALNPNSLDEDAKNQDHSHFHKLHDLVQDLDDYGAY